MRDREFEELYAEHAQPLFGFLVYRTGDRALSEDLLGETFERALRARRQFDPRRGSRKNWLYTIALNALRDHARRRAAEERAYERTAADGPEEAGERDALDALHDRDRLARALATLTAEEREAIGLRFGADMTVPEIARLKRRKLTTVEGRVYRALRKLSAALDEADGG